MKNKTIVITILGILLISFTSAGWFNLATKTKESHKPSFNILNDFKTTTLNRESICFVRNDRINLLSKINNNRKCIVPNKRKIDLITKYFKKNSNGIVRFQNK